MIKKSRFAILFVVIWFLLIGLCARNAQCQYITPAVVNGNTYTCYFVSSLDIFRTDIAFDEKGRMDFSTYQGDGFYFTLTTLFGGVYWSLNQTIGQRRGDFLFFLVGNTRDPFILGTCLILFEYQQPFFAVFFGFRAVQ
ncbi:MAG: hypothetical protein N3B18_06585 [Desulfobacterota bacterium]|nr:hypothetical protein [Thermodesulfobacteriota bacterium]